MQMKISFPGLIFAQYKSINIIIVNNINLTEGSPINSVYKSL